MFREIYRNSKRKILARAIKKTDTGIQNVTFRNKDTLETWTTTNRKRGRPKYKLTEKAIEQMWNSVKAANTELRNTTYDTNNTQVIRAMVEHAKHIYES